MTAYYSDNINGQRIFPQKTERTDTDMNHFGQTKYNFSSLNW